MDIRKMGNNLHQDETIALLGTYPSDTYTTTKILVQTYLLLLNSLKPDFGNSLDVIN